MNTKTFLLVAAATAALQLAPAISAQTTDKAERHARGRREQMMKNLSPEERTKIPTANKAAMADPAVQAAKEKAKTDRTREARQEFRAARRAAMLKADPSVQPILEKMVNRGGGDS